jgi:type II secretory pathway predicted ATPase ExeA
VYNLFVAEVVGSMDFAFYHLTGDPFASRLAPDRLFWHPRHQKVLQPLIYGIEGGKGFMALLGERGVGKKTLLYAYLAQRKQNNIRVISLAGVECTFATVLDRLCQHCGIARTEPDIETTLHRIYTTLAREREQGNRVVLTIDGAEDIPASTLERLLLLADMADATGKLLQVIFLGGPAFARYLKRDASAPLKQHIGIRVTLEPLTQQESLAYVQHRIANVSTTKEQLFTRGALRLIIRYARGNPGMLNYLCGEALNAARFQGQKPIKTATVRGVLQDVEGKPARPLLRWALLGLIGACVVAALVADIPHLGSIRLPQPQAWFQGNRAGESATTRLAPSQAHRDGQRYRPGIKPIVPKPDGPQLTDVEPLPPPVVAPADATATPDVPLSQAEPTQNAAAAVAPLPVASVVCLTARPNGNRRRDIILMDASGTIRQQLVADGSLNLAPVLSPDGKKLAYTSYRNGTPTLYLRHLKSDQDERITARAGFALAGAWSPNGRYLVLSMSENGNSDIFLYDTKQRHVMRLTTHPGIDISPSFAPDSTRLVFTSNRSGSSQIYLTTVEGLEPVRITTSGPYNTSAVWAPQGETIAFLGQSSSKKLDLYTIRADGTGLRQVTTGGSTIAEDPTWAPDGQAIMYTREHDGRRERRIVRVENQEDRELPGHGAVCHSPQWVAQQVR